MEIMPAGTILLDRDASPGQINPCEHSDGAYDYFALGVGADIADETLAVILMACGHSCTNFDSCRGVCCRCQGVQKRVSCRICRER